MNPITFSASVVPKREVWLNKAISKYAECVNQGWSAVEAAIYAGDHNVHCPAFIERNILGEDIFLGAYIFSLSLFRRERSASQKK